MVQAVDVKLQNGIGIQKYVLMGFPLMTTLKFETCKSMRFSQLVVEKQCIEYKLCIINDCVSSAAKEVCVAVKACQKHWVTFPMY